MPHDKAVRAAGKTAIGDHRDIPAETGAHDRRGRGQHLRHARPAFRAFIANDDHIALGYAPFFQRLEHLFLRVIDPGRAGKGQALLARDLGHGPARREVAL